GPGLRNSLGEVSITLEDMNRRELVLGTHSRSGDQWDIWQAVYSPVGNDGYPKPIWDKLTGRIDPSVAEYWREHYDLGHILQRDWPKLGKKLEGKIHLYCGTGDNYFLNNAVYLVEDILKNTKDPEYGGEVDYGDRAEHCWNGDHTQPNAISRLRYHQMHAPKIVDRIRKSAPVGADTTSWRYQKHPSGPRQHRLVAEVDHIVAAAKAGKVRPGDSPSTLACWQQVWSRSPKPTTKTLFEDTGFPCLVGSS